jgi:hypothetical protein
VASGTTENISRKASVAKNGQIQATSYFVRGGQQLYTLCNKAIHFRVCNGVGGLQCEGSLERMRRRRRRKKNSVSN